jgi:hypothetical protein
MEFVRQDGRMIRDPGDWQALDTLLAGLPVEQSFGTAYRLYSLPR